VAKWQPASLLYLWGVTAGLGCACHRAPALGRGLFVARLSSWGVLGLRSLMYCHGTARCRSLFGHLGPLV